MAHPRQHPDKSPRLGTKTISPSLSFLPDPSTQISHTQHHNNTINIMRLSRASASGAGAALISHSPHPRASLPSSSSSCAPRRVLARASETPDAPEDAERKPSGAQAKGGEIGESSSSLRARADRSPRRCIAASLHSPPPPPNAPTQTTIPESKSHHPPLQKAWASRRPGSRRSSSATRPPRSEAAAAATAPTSSSRRRRSSSGRRRRGQCARSRRSCSP